MATETIQIVVTQSGAVSVRKDIEGVGDGAKSAESGVSALTGALTSLITIGTAAYLANLVSTYTDLKSRVDLASGSVDTGNAVMQRLNDIAARTYSSLEQTTNGYIENSNALKDLGFSINDTLNYTEALNDALVVSGAKGEVAANTANALTKAMQLGKLSGENLNTVIQNGGRVAELLAEQLNTTVSGLRQVGAEGKITGDVISQALTGNLVKLRAEADAMPATIIDGVNRISLAFQVLVGTFDQTTGVSAEIALALVGIANHLDLVLIALSPLAVALLAFATQTIAVYLFDALVGLTTGLAGLASLIVGTMIPAVVGFVAALTGMAVTLVTETIPAVVAFTAALLTNPFFLAGATVAIAAVYAYRDSLKELGTQIVTTVGDMTDLNTVGKFIGDKFTIDLTGQALSASVKQAMNDALPQQQ
jgi:tape measure domain-containing protein